MAKDIATKVVVNNPDGSLFFRQENEWTNLNEETEAVLMEVLMKQAKYLDDLKQDQKKTPDAIFSATISAPATGLDDLHFESFTYDSFQKACHQWNKAGDEILRLGEKRIKGKGKP